jgi:hypothetical protein
MLSERRVKAAINAGFSGVWMRPEVLRYSSGRSNDLLDDKLVKRSPDGAEIETSLLVVTLDHSHVPK